VGPVLGFIEPDALLGDLLQPIVALGVAIILFEGGMSLKFADLRGNGSVVPLLVTVGLAVTWAVATVVAIFFLDLDLRVAILLGAVLVVSGPTVVIPLLRHIRPVGQTGSVLKWEGILIDPIGATLALVVFEVILAGHVQESTAQARLVVLRTLLIGGGLGLAGAAVLTLFLRKFWVPDYLQVPVTLMMVMGIFAGSNYVQEESGLLAVTIAGIALANQRFVSVNHIVEFKENLSILLLSGLFILLAARINLDNLSAVGWRSAILVGALIFVARPLAVVLSTLKSRLNWRERAFLSWMAPRGIVAAAVSALFALRLQGAGVPQSNQLLSLTFIVIIGTVVVYGLTGLPVAKWLKLAKPNPQGFLILGAHRWARLIAKALDTADREVLLVDTNWENVHAARQEGLRAVQANALSERAEDELDLGGIGRLLAMTSNTELNSLAALHFTEVFGREKVYQLPAPVKPNENIRDMPRHLRGRLLFSHGCTFDFITRQFTSGATIESLKLEKEEDY
ncbi:MAG: hypothetical protein FJ317_09810, partial [SAR202 cluster bacterium]|nr:hypothetical protein [SAR202 cluster bacterium]